jgi:hypothetical protein
LILGLERDPAVALKGPPKMGRRSGHRSNRYGSRSAGDTHRTEELGVHGSFWLGRARCRSVIGRVEHHEQVAFHSLHQLRGVPLVGIGREGVGKGIDPASFEPDDPGASAGSRAADFACAAEGAAQSSL